MFRNVPTCQLDSRQQPVCTSCPLGTEGDHCERCAVGYAGNPYTGCRLAKPSPPTSKCNLNHMRCSSSEECIPISARCNGRRDCPQGEDEQGCPSESIEGVTCSPLGSISLRPSSTTGLCECKVFTATVYILHQ